MSAGGTVNSRESVGHIAKFKLFAISSERITPNVTPICSFFHVATSGWQEAGWSSVRLHAIYDLARWTRSGPDLQMIWFSVCVQNPPRMRRPVPGHAVRINYTPPKVAQRHLTRACSKERSKRRRRCVLVSSAVNKRYWLGRELWVKSLTLLLPEGRCLLT